MEQRIRQLEELEALAAIFEGGLVVDDPSVGEWVEQRARGSDAVEPQQAAEFILPEATLTVSLFVEAPTVAGRWGELLLEVGLPPTYPSQTGAAACRLSYVAHRTPCAEKAAPASDLENESVMLRLDVLTAIAAELQSVSEQAADADEECVFELATRCADAAESAAETARAARNVD
eukprot:gene21876-21020_t